MFTQDLDSTARYRSLARGMGGGFARAYRASQRDRAGACGSGRGELDGVLPFGVQSGLAAPRAEQRRFRTSV
jgi:hypothetical protein